MSSNVNPLPTVEARKRQRISSREQCRYIEKYYRQDVYGHRSRINDNDWWEEFSIENEANLLWSQRQSRTR